MSGFFAFLAGILAIIITYLFGRREGREDSETKIKGELTISKQKTEKAEAERDLVVEAAKIASEPQTPEVHIQYSDISSQIQEARSNNDEESLKDIASQLAKQVLERHSR